MGKKQRDCAGCGAPVGIIGREHCCRCERTIRDAAAKAECPGCGKQRVLQEETGRCILCSRSCTQCGHPIRRQEDTLCRDCRRKARQAAAQRPCPRCRRPGYLREATGWCGPCSRPRQLKDPPRKCAQCGQVKRHEALGTCSACWQRRPADRAAAVLPLRPQPQGHPRRPDPTRGLAAREPRGFTGQTLALDKQRELFRRWTTGRDAHPHEALLGSLALLHGASSDEVRHLRVSGIDQTARTAQLGSRPLPVPLDPASWQVLQRCLGHRETQRTANPHVIVTKGTKAGRSPASTAYMSHLLNSCGVPPQTLRCTRLADLVSTLDPKLVAAAFGMKPEGVMFYLADHVDDGRLP